MDVRQEDGERILKAVERMLDDSDTIRAYVASTRQRLGEVDDDALCDALISAYATATGVSGGAAALPASLPGVGTMVALAGGALVDVALLLKYEVEMALALLHVYEFDIDGPEERELAFALAGLSTVEAKSGNDGADWLRAEVDALYAFGGHHVRKVVVTAFAKVALLQVGKSALRALPLLGTLVGAGLNHTLTKRVGHSVHQSVRRRRREMREGREAAVAHGVEVDHDGVVDAYVEGEE